MGVMYFRISVSRMRSNCLVLLLLVYPIAVRGQSAPTQAFG